MSFAFTRGNAIITRNSTISNSSINTSSINMNNSVITGHNLPVNGTDVVNKNFVDNLMNSTTITLTSTNFTTIINILQGDLTISVKNLITGGPSAKFSLSKSVSTLGAHIIRINSSAAVTSNEKLQIKWEINTGIELQKTGINYDGQYSIKYTVN